MLLFSKEVFDDLSAEEKQMVFDYLAGNPFIMRLIDKQIEHVQKEILEGSDPYAANTQTETMSYVFYHRMQFAALNTLRMLKAVLTDVRKGQQAKKEGQ